MENISIDKFKREYDKFKEKYLSQYNCIPVLDSEDGEYKEKMYFIACEYMAITELMDENLPHFTSPIDNTSAVPINGYWLRVSKSFSDSLREKLMYEYDLRSSDWYYVLEIIKKANYSAKRWIDEYNKINESRGQ